MPSNKLKDSAFRAGKSESNKGVSKPKRGSGPGNAAPGNASNSASPSNPGGLNVLKKVKADGSFKTSNR